MATIKLWLYDTRNRVAWSQVPCHELHVILDEVNGNLIGVRGADIFTIDYKFVTSVSL